MIIGSYTIADDLNLDTESATGNRQGYIETWKHGKDTIYCIKGNLPEYVNKKLAEIAERRGYLHWFNNGKRKDVKL